MKLGQNIPPQRRARRGFLIFMIFMIYCQKILLCVLPSIQLDSDMFSNMFNSISIMFWLGLMIFYGFSVGVGGFGRKGGPNHQTTAKGGSKPSDNIKIDPRMFKIKIFRPFFFFIKMCLNKFFRHF